MSALRDAEAHLAKAQEFFDAAEIEMEWKLYNAATSSAVTSGINSKDAICLKLTGKTGKTQNHADAVKELRQAGKAGADVAPKLRRLLNSKAKAQYQTSEVAKGEAEESIERAKALLEGARSVIAS